MRSVSLVRLFAPLVLIALLLAPAERPSVSAQEHQAFGAASIPDGPTSLRGGPDGPVDVAAVAAVSASPTPTPDSQPARSETGREPATVKRGSAEVETTRFVEETAPDGHPMRAGSLIVKFRRDASDTAREAADREVGVLSRERLGQDHLHRAQVAPDTVREALAAYRSRPDVEYAEPDYIRRRTLTPSDPRLSEQYNLAKISAPAAWDRTRSSREIRVAILDTGIWSGSSQFPARDGRPGHPDIRDKVVAERNFSGTNSVDDFDGHGTHTAGVAAASTNNRVGIAGVGFNASIMNVKVLNDFGQGADSDIINGIVWSANNGARVINLSLEGPGPCTSAFREAIDYAFARNAVIVAAAGNDGARGVDAPANCRNVVSVGAVNRDDQRASFSDFGPDVDIAAPGVAILGLDSYDQEGQTGYRTISGTSEASPHVAGVAGLVWTTEFGTSSQAVVDRILRTGDRIAGTGTLTANGRVNAAAAVGPPPSNPPASDPSTPPSGPLPALAIEDQTVRETDEGGRNAVFTVTLSSPSRDTVTVDFKTAPETAEAGSDFRATSGTVTFRSGETAHTVRVPIVADDRAERSERFTVSLRNARNATIADGRGTAIIRDDDN